MWFEARDLWQFVKYNKTTSSGKYEFESAELAGTKELISTERSALCVTKSWLIN